MLTGTKTTCFWELRYKLWLRWRTHVHGGRLSHPTYLPPSTESHVATLTTSVIPKDGDSYTQPPGQCLWLGQGPGRGPALVPGTSGSLGINTSSPWVHRIVQGKVLISWTLWRACLKRQTLEPHKKLNTWSGARKSAFWKADQGNRSKAALELHPLRAECLKRESIKTRGQLLPCPPRAVVASLLEIWVGSPIFWHSLHLPIYSLPQGKFLSVRRWVFYFLSLAVTLVWRSSSIHSGRGDRAKRQDTWADRLYREERTWVGDKPRLGTARVRKEKPIPHHGIQNWILKWLLTH